MPEHRRHERAWKIRFVDVLIAPTAAKLRYYAFFPYGASHVGHRHHSAVSCDSRRSARHRFGARDRNAHAHSVGDPGGSQPRRGLAPRPQASRWRSPFRGADHVALKASPAVNFQVTVLKVLVSYPGGFAVMDDIKRVWRSWQPAAGIGPTGPGGWLRAYLTSTCFPKDWSIAKAVVGRLREKVGQCSNSWKRVPAPTGRSRRSRPWRSVRQCLRCHRSRSARSEGGNGASDAAKDASELERQHSEGASACNSRHRIRPRRARAAVRGHGQAMVLIVRAL